MVDGGHYFSRRCRLSKGGSISAYAALPSCILGRRSDCKPAGLKACVLKSSTNGEFTLLTVAWPDFTVVTYHKRLDGSRRFRQVGLSPKGRLYG